MFEQQAQEAFELLQKMVSIPSISHEEDALADFLERYIEEQGYTSSRLDNNVWIMGPGFDPKRPTLLLKSHINAAKIESEKLYNQDSNIAVASVVSLLHTFFLLSRESQHYNLLFAASTEKEMSDENGIRKLQDELPKIDFAVVGEPTEMQMAVSATPLEHPFVQRGREMGLRLWGTATLSDQPRMNFPSVKIGPGNSAHSHTSEEYILFSGIEEAIATYYQLLNKLEFKKV